MSDTFDIYLSESFNREELIAAMAIAYNISADEIDLQRFGEFNECAQSKSLFALIWTDDNTNYPMLITISSHERVSQKSIREVASKISEALGCDALISDETCVGYMMLQISGICPAEVVLVYDEYDAAGKCIGLQVEKY